jgi:hypothetical protein
MATLGLEIDTIRAGGTRVLKKFQAGSPHSHLTLLVAISEASESLSTSAEQNLRGCSSMRRLASFGK